MEMWQRLVLCCISCTFCVALDSPWKLGQGSSEAPDNQGYTGLAWAEFGVEKAWGAVLLVSV